MEAVEEFLSELAANSTAPPLSHCDANATAALHSTWIYKYFGDCVVVPRQYFAFLVGLLSLVAWIFAQFPQIVANCKSGEADKSLSFWLLLLWLCSDSANFLGTILTNQLITQVIMGAYFVFVDIVTLAQFCLHFFRNRRKRRNQDRESKYGTMNKSSTSINILGLTIVLLPSVLFLVIPASSAPQPHNSAPERWSHRTLLEVGGQGEEHAIFDGWEFIVGYTLGCFSAVVYFFALPPQIIKNFQRCSVSGLSLLMFVFITFGDCTYLLSILLFSVERVFIIRSLPWLLGSAFSIFFDIFLLIQISIYKCLDRSRSKELDSLTKA